MQLQEGNIRTDSTDSFQSHPLKLPAFPEYQLDDLPNLLILCTSKIILKIHKRVVGHLEKQWKTTVRHSGRDGILKFKFLLQSVEQCLKNKQIVNMRLPILKNQVARNCTEQQLQERRQLEGENYADQIDSTIREIFKFGFNSKTCVVAPQQLKQFCLGPNFTCSLYTKPLIPVSWQQFVNSVSLLPNICALLNRGRGSIVVASEEDSIQNFFSEEQKVEWIKYVRKCLNYIGPQICNASKVLRLQFMPSAGPNLLFEGIKQVIRIQIDRYKQNEAYCQKSLFFVNFQGGSGGKNSTVSSFEYSESKKAIQEVQASRIYEKMLEKFSFRQLPIQDNSDHVCTKFKPKKTGCMKEINKVKEKSEEQFEHYSYFIFSQSEKYVEKLEAVEKALYSKKIIFKLYDPYPNQFKIQPGKQRIFRVLLHNETHDTIRLILDKVLKGSSQLFKPSSLLKIKNKDDFFLKKQAFLKKLHQHYSKEQKGNECFEEIEKLGVHNVNFYLKFNSPRSALFGLCILDDLGGSRSDMVPEKILFKKKGF